MKSKHWWRTASRSEIEAYQGKSLHWFLTNRVVPFTKHYRDCFSELGISPHGIRTVEDLQKIPFTYKSMITNPRDFVITPDEEVLKRQPSTIKKFLMHGPSLKEEFEKEFRPIFLTSTTGRSSQPLPFTYTQHDIANLIEGGRRIGELAQAGPDFRMINAFPFAPHLAFWQGHYTSFGANMFTLSTGGGKTIGTDGNCRVISKINPDLIIGMPTFMYHLMQHGAKKGMKWTNLKLLVMGGEKVPAGMRKKLNTLAQRVGAPGIQIISTYGFTEAKLVFRGSVVMRYRTGDLIENGITWEKCPHCGSTAPRLIGKISRVSDIKRLNISKLKGNLVDFNKLEHLLDDNKNLGAWQIEIRKRNDDPLERDELIVHAVPMRGADEDKLSDSIRRHMREQTEISPNDINFYSWEKMRALQGVGEELKEKKLIDNRPKLSS